MSRLRTWNSPSAAARHLQVQQNDAIVRGLQCLRFLHRGLAMGIRGKRMMGGRKQVRTTENDLGALKNERCEGENDFGAAKNNFEKLKTTPEGPKTTLRMRKREGVKIFV